MANWRIFIETSKTERLLGFIPVNRGLKCPIHLGEQLLDVFKSDNINVIDYGLE